MAERVDIPDIRAALAQRLYPTVTVWNRLEGRPRSADFVAQPARRGARRAVDALAPVAARRVRRRRRRLAVLREAARRHERAARIPAGRGRGRRRSPRTCRSRRWSSGGACRSRSAARRSRSTCGSPWAGAGSRSSAPIGELRATRSGSSYRFELPDPDDPDDATICAHPTAWAAVAAVAGRALDGGALYQHLASDSRTTPTTVSSGSIRTTTTRSTMPRTRSWAGSRISSCSRPADDAWQPDRLEYRFAVLGAGRGRRRGARRRRVRRRAARLARRGRRSRRRAGSPPATPRAEGDVLQAGVPVPVTSRDAERALVGVRGRPDELRRRVGVDDRPREAALLRVRPGLRQRLVPVAVRPAARLARARARPRGDHRLRRARSGSSRPARAPTGLAAALLAVHVRPHGRHRPAARTAASCCCRRRRRSCRASRSSRSR